MSRRSFVRSAVAVLFAAAATAAMLSFLTACECQKMSLNPTQPFWTCDIAK